jgi:hypothetical protein
MRLLDDRDDDLDDDEAPAGEGARAADVADLFDFLAKSAWREVAALHAEADADGDALLAAVVRERDAAVREGSWAPLRAPGPAAPAGPGLEYLVGLLADTPRDYHALVRLAERARDEPGARVLAVEGAGAALLTVAVRVRAADPSAARRAVDAAVAEAASDGGDDPPAYAHMGEPERAE